MLLSSHSNISGEINVTPFNPLNTIKYERAVSATPPKIPPVYRILRSNWNEKIKREIYCTMVPTVNAITTEIRIPNIISVAF